MTGNDRTILLVVPVIVAVIAFWFMVLSPKQDKAGKLDTQVTTLQSSVESQKAAAEQGLQARKQFPTDYHRLVVFGKAVPVDDETASLIVQINRIAEHSGVSFRKIDLTAGASTGAAPVATAPVTPAPESSDSSSTEASSTTPAPAVAAVPTEASAASLPIGAAVGSAGLPTLPYTLVFRGDYFQIADFMAGMDSLVKTGKGRIQADGRLVTVDAFSMAGPDNGPPGVLEVNLTVTTYVTPASQGLTAGATPTAPAATTTPTSAPATP